MRLLRGANLTELHVCTIPIVVAAKLGNISLRNTSLISFDPRNIFFANHQFSMRTNVDAMCSERRSVGIWRVAPFRAVRSSFSL